MNVETGELRRFAAERAEIEAAISQHFKEVPEEHTAEAEKALGDRDSIFVDMNKRTPLVKWAKEQRKIGRNEPCPCGSGKKYKKCCLDKSQ